MKKRIASMLAATVLLLSVIALPASAQTDWFGNSDLTTAKVREIADADTLTESQIAEINNHYSEYEIMQGISKTLIEDYTDTFYISQKLSNSTGNSILDVLNDAFSDGSSEWVGYKGGFFSYNDDACVLVTAKGMSFSESGDYSLTYVESGKTTTLTDSRGFEQEADIYYAYNTDEFSEAYENLNTVDNEIADESSLIFEFLIGNENYTDWQ